VETNNLGPPWFDAYKIFRSEDLASEGVKKIRNFLRNFSDTQVALCELDPGDRERWG
jgi:hypothetical protein